MGKEASTFFLMAVVGLMLAIGYIESQGGNPFASAHSGTDYRSIAYQDAVNAGIPPDYFVAQINDESGFNPSAYSPAGAEGIAQFMPSTASGLGINPWNPVQSLQGAAQLMSRYDQKYGGYDKALAAYQCGSGCLESAVANYGIYWKGHVSASTRAYIAIIMGE